MFTGIVEELGTVVAIEHGAGAARLRVRGPRVTAGTAPGDSIAVNGVCLTAVAVADAQFTADVMPETLHRTSLGGLSAGDPVNLERAVRPADRLGGHLVQGHVDGVGTLLSRQPGTAWDLVRVGVPVALARYLAEKASVTVDGVSLTISAVSTPGSAPPWFEVGLIPATLVATTLGGLQPGAQVNVEVDVVAKYVERLLAHQPGAPAPGSAAGSAVAAATAVASATVEQR